MIESRHFICKALLQLSVLILIAIVLDQFCKRDLFAITNNERMITLIPKYRSSKSI